MYGLFSLPDRELLVYLALPLCYGDERCSPMIVCLGDYEAVSRAGIGRKTLICYTEGAEIHVRI